MENSDRDRKKGRPMTPSGSKAKGFFLLGWAPADLYFQEWQTNN
jgi:hypothetical protein